MADQIADILFAFEQSVRLQINHGVCRQAGRNQRGQPLVRLCEYSDSVHHHISLLCDR